MVAKRGKTGGVLRVPHPFPYQGSKRAIADRILSHLPFGVGRLVEPFCGSAAVSVAAACRGRAARFWLNDRNFHLTALWTEILDDPGRLAEGYERLWRAQRRDPKAFFLRTRERFNRTGEPHLLLYLLARGVKAAVRYNASGAFNQSPDNRRLGMQPGRLRRQLIRVSALLAGSTRVTALDFREVISETKRAEVLYLDPPYQGVSFARDRRYRHGVGYEEIVAVLQEMIEARRSFLISYDGRTGDREHGRPLPARLGLRHLSIPTGRSSQSTLLGRNCETVESLYLSPALVDRLDALARPVPG